MAAFNRPTEANYEVHENVRVDTLDNEDHTFCGIMFPIKAKEDLPVTQIVINAVAVRGQLGPLTVWVSKPAPLNAVAAPARGPGNPNNPPQSYRFPLQKRYWTRIYQQAHAPSPRQYVWLDLSANPVVLQPGQVRALYIHSTLESDEAIVYDNASTWQGYRFPVRRDGRSTPRYQDAFCSFWTGKAHLSPRPFGQTPIWGWGNAWRDHREFVGQIAYGVRYKLWQPTLTTRYGPEFRRAVQTLLACQRRLESPVALLPDECLYYILNMCRWDWWNDAATSLKEERRSRRRRLRQQEQEEEEERNQQQPLGGGVAVAPAAGSAMETSSSHHSRRNRWLRRESQRDSSIAAEESPGSMEESQHVDADTSDDEEMQEEEIDEAESEGEENDVDEDDEDEEWEEDAEVVVDSDSDDSAWERHHGYRANANVFTYHDVSSDEESNDNNNEDAEALAAAERQAWFRRRFAHIHILRDMVQAAADDNNDLNGVVMHVDHGDSDSGEEEDDDDEVGGGTDDGEYEALHDTDEE